MESSENDSAPVMSADIDYDPWGLGDEEEERKRTGKLVRHIKVGRR